MKKLSSRKCAAFCLAGAVLAAGCGQAQTFKVYDQMTHPDGSLSDGSGWGLLIRTNEPSGQSFVPTLAEIAFVELSLGTHMAVLGARTETISLWLREDTITGRVLGETDAITVNYSPPWGELIQELDFLAPVTVLPGQRYVFELRHLGGDDLLTVACDTPHLMGQDYYPAGELIWQGTPVQGVDIWFREGVVVPEPRTWALMPLAAAAVLVVKRRWRRPSS